MKLGTREAFGVGGGGAHAVKAPVWARGAGIELAHCGRLLDLPGDLVDQPTAHQPPWAAATGQERGWLAMTKVRHAGGKRPRFAGDGRRGAPGMSSGHPRRLPEAPRVTPRVPMPADDRRSMADVARRRRCRHVDEIGRGTAPAPRGSGAPRCPPSGSGRWLGGVLGRARMVVEVERQARPFRTCWSTGRD